jgi:hypothetical protein
MNSPVSCLPDPIQNMGISRLKNRRRVVSRVPRGISAKASAPAAMGATVGRRDQYPVIGGMAGQLRVSNYELVHVLAAGNGAFTIGGDVLNPGLAGNFPWLSTIAKGYSKFNWRFLRYIYVPACSTATAGVEFLYYKYDYLDNPAASTTQVMSTDRSAMGSCWFGQPINEVSAFKKDLPNTENISVDLDVSKMSEDWYYVRTGNNANQPVNTTGAPTGGIGTFAITPMYDPNAFPGIIYYGNEGTAGTATNGYLFCSYIVDFIEPESPAVNS